MMRLLRSASLGLVLAAIAMFAVQPHTPVLIVQMGTSWEKSYADFVPALKLVDQTARDAVITASTMLEHVNLLTAVATAMALIAAVLLFQTPRAFRRNFRHSSDPPSSAQIPI